MKEFSKIKIITNNEDIYIEQGDKLAIFYGRYDVENDCLNIIAYDDVTIVLPDRHYKEISVITMNGDCSIKLPDTCIDKIIYYSHDGDLNVATKCDDIDFESTNGDLYRDNYVESIFPRSGSEKERY